MRIDNLSDRSGSEPISERLWRRYGRRAFEMLDDIREDPSMAEDVLDSSDYLRVELHNTASTEMVVKLDDFLRRRSKIALITRDEDVGLLRGYKRSPIFCLALMRITNLKSISEHSLKLDVLGIVLTLL